MVSMTDYIKFFVALLSVVNAVGSIPVYINLTRNLTGKEGLRAARIAATTSCVVLLVALFSGETVLRFFGISIASFRVGGGILLLLMAISMMHARMSPAKYTPEEAKDKEESDAVAVVPLGLPLLAGPGAISTVIVYSNRINSWESYGILAGIIVLIAFSTWGILRGSVYIADFLGRTGINIITRIMGLIIAAIAVEFITNGLKQIFPALM